MKDLVTHLGQYAGYHRDWRNILTHFAGIPMIVLGVATLLSRPEIALGGFTITPAIIIAVFLAPFYLRLDLALGLATIAMYLLALLFGVYWAAQSDQAWLVAGIGLFVTGWIIQFVGHVIEGRKPAFVDDIAGLAIGPLFVVAELAFLLGWRIALRDEIARRSGPVRHCGGSTTTG